MYFILINRSKYINLIRLIIKSTVQIFNIYILFFFSNMYVCYQVMESLLAAIMLDTLYYSFIIIYFKINKFIRLNATLVLKFFFSSLVLFTLKKKLIVEISN